MPHPPIRLRLRSAHDLLAHPAKAGDMWPAASCGHWCIAVPTRGGGVILFTTNEKLRGREQHWLKFGGPDDLTLSPSVDLGPGPDGWHGFVTNGQLISAELEDS